MQWQQYVCAFGYVENNRENRTFVGKSYFCSGDYFPNFDQTSAKANNSDNLQLSNKIFLSAKLRVASSPKLPNCVQKIRFKVMSRSQGPLIS